MIRTITLGDHVSVQGLFVGRLADGRICVRVGDTVYAGPPVPRLARGRPPAPEPQTLTETA